MSSDSGQSSLIGGHITNSLESLKVTPPTKHAGDQTRLSNGHSEAHIESSVDESPPLNSELVLEVESTSNGEGDSSPNYPPVTKEKTLSPNDSLITTSRQASHEREDSSSSLATSGGETETIESSSSSSSRLLGGESDATLTSSSYNLRSDATMTSSYSLNQTSGLSLDTSRSDNDARGDNEQPLSSEVAVAHSPGGRFLKYDIEIGRGSFKTVYKGLDTETGVAIAWCELKEKRYSKAEQARFKEEVAILKTLQHPNILKLYDSWESAVNKTERKDKLKDKVLVLITELMTSGTLKSYMRRLKSIKPKVIRSWGRQILKGLHFLHTRIPPIIHRDLKCDNIFINGTTGLVKIGDLGLATLKRNDVSTVIGTPEFMAPEMYDESYDESVDVYAFGMCLLEMCTQEYPYMECSNPAQIYKKVSQGIKPHAIDKVKDASLRDIIDKCTTVDKVQRFDVLDLLNHEYFSENIKIEMVPVDIQSTEPTSLRTMRMDVPNQDTNKKNGQESIEFPYDLTKDIPEDVVHEMVKSRVLSPSVQQMVVRSLREYVEGVKQKLLGRNKTENTNSDGKLAEPKPDPFSQTPSPSPGTTNEAPPTDSDVSPASMQRQASGLQRQTSGQSETVKPEEQVVPKELLQGLDITGQGALPTSADKESMSKGSDTKTNDLLFPVSQHASEQNVSNGQQITASTGQPVPQMNSMKVLSARSQSSSTVMDYSLAVKEGSSTERHTGALSIDATQETGYLSGTSLQELTIQQPSQNDDSGVSMSSGGAGTLKKKGQRQKGKGIKLTLIEHLSETKKLVCQLTSNSKLLKYQFSIKYDKPEEMFKKFVTGGYLTEQDKDEFILQSNELIHSVKKGKDLKIEMPETKLGIQEQGKSRASAEPLTSPPTETAESASIEQTSHNEPRSSKNLNFTGPKLEPSKQSQVPTPETQPIVPNSDRMVTPEPLKEIPNPLSVPNSGTNGGASSQRGQPQPLSVPNSGTNGGASSQRGQPQGDNVSTLVTHTTTQDLPRPHSPGSKSQPQQLLPNPLITGAQMNNLSSCSLPSLITQFPVALPVCNPSTQFLINSTVHPMQTNSTSRVFEVETVTEHQPDSPDSDELSVLGSVESLGRETPRSISQDSNGQVVAKRFIVQSVPSLESKSDSYIGKEPSPPELSTSTANQYPPSQISANVQYSNLGLEDTKPTKNNSVPMYVLPLRVTRPSQRPSQTCSIPEHYCTTPVPNTTGQRGGITDETYVPLAYRRYPSSNTIPSHPTFSCSDAEGLEQEVPVDRPMNIDELPQASLLSEAFMRFMHSMSTVFRDPTFQPLISSLDQRFSRQQIPDPSSATYNRVHDPADRRYSSQSVPARSQHEVFDRRFNSQVVGEAESSLYTRAQDSHASRSVTDPGGAIPDSSRDVELRTALEEIEEEQRKLERRRQQVIQNFRRKHSSGNSSLESSSGLPETRKTSTTSYDFYTTSSPTTARRIAAKMNEYEEAGGGSDSSSSTIGTPHKPGNNSMAVLEKRVRDELMSDKLGFDTALPANFDSSPSRSRTPQQPLTRIGSSLGQPDRGGSISPNLQASPPPPLQTVEQATFQMHASPGAPIVHQVIPKIPHSDSGEWTDYTSAPVVQQAGGYSDNRLNYSSTSTRGPLSTMRTSSTQSLSTMSSSKADVSEFDPITSSTGPKS